jgi:hypothetical protein
MVLTKTFPSETFARALESWAWLDLTGKVPVLASLFGDVFLQDRTGYWFLDSMQGRLSTVAANRDELQSILDTETARTSTCWVAWRLRLRSAASP